MLIVLLLAFMCYPLAMLFVAAFRIRERNYQMVILMFFLLGAYLLVPYEFGDIRLYSETLERYRYIDFIIFIKRIEARIFGTGEGGFEIFIDLNLFLVSRITDNLALSFCISSLFIFYFWRATVLKLVKEYDLYNSTSKNKTAIYLLIAFSLYIIFFRAINGRFYIAYWVFIYAFYRIVVEKKYKFYILLCSTIFIHQSYIFLVALTLVYQVTSRFHNSKKFEKILLVLIVLSTIYSQTGLTVMNEYLSKIGGDFENKYDAYLKSSYIGNQLGRNKPWFIDLRTPLLFFSLGLSVLIARFSKSIKFDETTSRIYYFALLFWIVNAFTINVPSFGERFRNVLMGVFLLLLFKIYNTNKYVKIPRTILIVLVSFVFYKIVTLKILEFYINKWMLYPFSFFLDLLLGSVPIGK